MSRTGQHAVPLVAQSGRWGRRLWLSKRPGVSEARLLAEGLWVAAGHAIAAVAALIGVRLTTELVPAALFGAFVLLNGVLALLQGVLLQPLAQAALRYYPEYVSRGSAAVLRRHLVAVFARRWGWSLVVFGAVGSLDVVTLKCLSPVTWLLLAGALGLEAWRTIEIILRNAGCRQVSYGAFYAADAIARSAGVVVAAWALSASVESLLFGQCIGGLTVLGGSSALREREVRTAEENTLSHVEADAIADGMSDFAAPLQWSPILGWVSGLADRYIVGGMLGLGSAGVYAAACGLVSRPMLMIGAVTDATLRQRLYSAAAQHETGVVRWTLIIWLIANVAASGLVALIVTMFSGAIMDLLLAADYRRDAATLVPWVAAGYVLVLLDQVIGRLLYARGRTSAVVGVQAASAALAVLVASVAVWWNGLLGAAMAIPVYFGVQLTLSIVVAIRTTRIAG